MYYQLTPAPFQRGVPPRNVLSVTSAPPQLRGYCICLSLLYSLFLIFLRLIYLPLSSWLLVCAANQYNFTLKCKRNTNNGVTSLRNFAVTVFAFSFFILYSLFFILFLSFPLTSGLLVRAAIHHNFTPKF